MRRFVGNPCIEEVIVAANRNQRYTLGRWRLLNAQIATTCCFVWVRQEASRDIEFMLDDSKRGGVVREDEQRLYSEVFEFLTRG